MATKLGRKVVRSEPTLVFTATEECIVKMFVPPISLDEESNNPVVVVQIDEPPAVPYGDENSALVPFTWGFEVHLDAGQALWALSPGESMLVFSVIPRSAR